MSAFQKKIIDQDITLAEMIGAARARKGVSVEDAARILHIQPHHLRAFEDGHIDTLPGEVYAKKYLERYCRFLDIPSSDAQQKLDVLIAEEGLWVRTPKEVSIAPRHLRISTQWLRIGMVALALMFLLGYFGVKLIGLRRAPALVVQHPPEGHVTHVSEITVSGVTESEARLFINGVAVPVSQKGSFSFPVTLSTGVNYIQFNVARRFGAAREVTLTIVREEAYEGAGETRARDGAQDSAKQ